MNTQRNITIISMAFVVLLGAMSIYSAIDILLDPEYIQKGYILSQQHNIFIRYSPSFCLGYAGLIFIALPFIILKNIMSLGENYLTANDRLKSKMTLAAHTLFLPATLFFITSIYFSEDIKKKNLLLLLSVLAVTYVYAKNSYIYFMNKRKCST